MATSAQTLSLIIDELLQAKPANRAEAITLLSAKGYLPKKLLEEPKPVKPVSVFASKAAQDYAEANDIVVPEGFKGTAAKDKISVSDLKKLKEPPKAKLNGSPSALKYARDNNIDLTDFVGSGEDGKIMLKDVKALKPEETPKPSEPGPSTLPEPEVTPEPEKKDSKITPAAAKAIQKYGIDEDDLKDITPSGKNGELLLKDLKDLIELFKAEAGEKVESEDEY
jgi:pyruvate/2-oxoglutarate dehydrogenase complex dihydrolipoamide acyltransferase (E2) component